MGKGCGLTLENNSSASFMNIFEYGAYVGFSLEW